MEKSIFDRVTVNQDQFLNALFWQLTSQIGFPESTWGIQKQSLGMVSSGVFESRIKVSNRRETWNQAGWISAYAYQQFCFSQWVPIGDSFLFLPPERDEYELFYSPVRWLFNVSVELHQFTGQWSERLRRIESKLDSLESPVDVVTDFLEGPGSPLDGIQEQIDEIPEQITETLDIRSNEAEENPEWDWRSSLPN